MASHFSFKFQLQIFFSFTSPSCLLISIYEGKPISGTCNQFIYTHLVIVAPHLPLVLFLLSSHLIPYTHPHTIIVNIVYKPINIKI